MTTTHPSTLPEAAIIQRNSADESASAAHHNHPTVRMLVSEGGADELTVSPDPSPGHSGGGRAELTAGGVASDKPDRGGTDEQDDPDDREPKQTLEGEPDNRRDKPEHEQNDDENDHTILRTFQKVGYGSSLTYPSLGGDVDVRASRQHLQQPPKPSPFDPVTTTSTRPPREERGQLRSDLAVA